MEKIGSDQVKGVDRVWDVVLVAHVAVVQAVVDVGQVVVDQRFRLDIVALVIGRICETIRKSFPI